MKIIDTTTYFEEKLMMELRFNILDPYVDQFVVCEATFTHSGMKKPIKFNKEDYPDFKDKIIHLILDKEPSNLIKNENKPTTNELRLNSIKRIEAQRNHIGTILENFSQDDYIIYSDNDEIPNLKNFDFKKNKNKIILFKQKLFYYKFDLSIPYIDWYGSKSCKIKDFLNTTWLRNIKNKKYHLVASTLTNLFFIHDNYKKFVEKKNIRLEDIRDDSDVKNFIFSSYDGTIFTSKPIDVSWHKIKIENKKFQILPKYLRKFPGDYNAIEKIAFYFYREILFPGRILKKLFKKKD